MEGVNENGVRPQVCFRGNRVAAAASPEPPVSFLPRRQTRNLRPELQVSVCVPLPPKTMEKKPEIIPDYSQDHPLLAQVWSRQPSLLHTHLQEADFLSRGAEKQQAG